MSIQPAIIIDNGSQLCKAGTSGYEGPDAIFPNVIGRCKNPRVMFGYDDRDKYPGDEAQSKRGVLDLQYPMENGIVKNWEDMEDVLHHAFYVEIRRSPDESPVFLTETPLNPKKNREKMASLLFESFLVPSLYISDTALLTLYAVGYLNGIVVSSGDGVTSCTPVMEGNYINHAIERSNLAGRVCTDWLSKLLQELGHQFSTSAEREIVREMKEKICYVALDYESEIAKAKISSSNHKEYELPDLNKIKMQNQSFRCPEILFDPSPIMKAPGIHELTNNSILKCDIDVRQKLQQNIILDGGSTMFPGFTERFEKEIKAMLPSTANPRVLAPKNRNLSVWYGASILTSLSTFQSNWISKAQYDESGCSIVHRKP